jgi:hypothetical protein
MSLLVDLLLDVVAEVVGSGLSGGRQGPTDAVSVELAHIRKRRRWVIGLSLLFVPVVVVFSFFAPRGNAIGLAIVWAGWIAVMGIFLIRSRCPRCEARFFRVGPQMLGRGNRIGANPWVNRCGNCGLSLDGPGAEPSR